MSSALPLLMPFGFTPAPFTEANGVACLWSQTVNEIMALSLPITLRNTELSRYLSPHLCSVTQIFDFFSSALAKRGKKTDTFWTQPNVAQFLCSAGSLLTHRDITYLLHLLAPDCVKCLNTRLSSKKQTKGGGGVEGGHKLGHLEHIAHICPSSFHYFHLMLSLAFHSHEKICPQFQNPFFTIMSSHSFSSKTRRCFFSHAASSSIYVTSKPTRPECQFLHLVIFSLASSLN